MSYVDAGYAAALGVLFVYGIGLMVRRRRWERAARLSEGPDGTAAPPGGRP